MKNKKYSRLTFMSAVFAALVATSCSSMTSNSKTTVLEQPQEEPTISETVAAQVLSEIKPEPQRKYLRGIHLSAWISGPTKHRVAVEQVFADTELNTAVIDIKEYEGQVYIDGVKMAEENHTYFPAMKNLKEYLAELKEKGIYTIARLVVFKDNLMPLKKPSLAVKNPDGTLWKDRKGSTWLDPYNKDAWEYNIQIAERAIDLGFQEIQFDYIRFPSDGNTKNCRYSNKKHSRAEAPKAIVEFLKEAAKRIRDKGGKVSIDVFGLTTTSQDDMGIGQKIVDMAEQVDYVSPMVYPSHYAKGEYGIADPDKSPYATVYKSMEGAARRIPKEKLRPWLQDFSLGVKYTKEEVRAQIQACYDNDIPDWLLWNPRCVYTRDALKGQDAETEYKKSDPPTPEMIKTQEKLNTTESGVQSSTGTAVNISTGTAAVNEKPADKKENKKKTIKTAKKQKTKTLARAA